MLHTRVQNIDKSLICKYSFSNEDVLEDKNTRVIRRANLLKALKLGNLNKQHVQLHFISSQGIHMKSRVTVWAVTRKHVVLKASKIIPISSILSVEF